MREHPTQDAVEPPRPAPPPPPPPPAAAAKAKPWIRLHVRGGNYLESREHALQQAQIYFGADASALSIRQDGANDGMRTHGGGVIYFETDWIITLENEESITLENDET